MEEVNIYEYNNNIKVYYTNTRASLPEEYRCEVERHWESLIQMGKKFFRGEIFTITDIKHEGEQIQIFVELTDYAHFLYTIHKGKYEGHDCRVIYTSVMIETSDKKFAIGEMNSYTAAPGKLQFIGGGIDNGDIRENEIDLRHSISKEIREETGINVEDRNVVKSLEPYLLKTGGKSNFLSAIFKLNLLISGSELLDSFERYNRRLISGGASPEIKSLVLINADCNSVINFITNDTRQKDENLVPAIKAAVNGIHKLEVGVKL